MDNANQENHIASSFQSMQMNVIGDQSDMMQSEDDYSNAGEPFSQPLFATNQKQSTFSKGKGTFNPAAFKDVGHMYSRSQHKKEMKEAVEMREQN